MRSRASPKTRALYLYPTKALAQDQARALAALRLKGLRPAIYDGDTESERRWQIRKWANVILTNPDMLHLGVLPHHDRWGDVFANLRFVVIDEAHVYRGVFGSHVGNVLRRLRRIASALRSRPAAPACVGDDRERGRAGRGADGRAGDGDRPDGAPHAEREIAIWNPPLIDPELGLRASALARGVPAARRARLAGLRTICFTKSRKAAELVHRFTAERVDAATAERLAPYRAGYTPEQRREIERRLVEGELLGVTATDALELGIDIGLLDCAISVGFPGTVASLRQQWGRAGRRGHGLGVLVCSEDALDQFFARDPEALLSRRVEAAILDHASPRILEPHVYAAAYEAPLDDADAAILGPEALERAAGLTRARANAGRLGLEGAGLSGRADLAALGRRRGVHASSTTRPAPSSVSSSASAPTRRSTTGRSTSISASSTAYAQLDLDARTALVSPLTADWYTQVKKETETAIEESLRAEQRLGVDLHFGRVSVTEQVVAYQRKAIADGSTIETVPLELPVTTFETEAIWFCPGDGLLEGFEKMPALLGTLHAAEHSLIALLPLWAMCDRWDIGGLSTNVHFQTGRPTIFVYDGHAGGVGLTERGFERFEGWARTRRECWPAARARAAAPRASRAPSAGT